MERSVGGLWLVAVILGLLAWGLTAGVFPVARQEGMTPVSEALEAQARN